MTPSFQLTRVAPRSFAIAIAACAALLGFIVSARASHAATCTFAATTDSNFSTAGNWTGCAGPPTSADDVVIPASTSTVLDTPADISNLYIGTGATFDTTGNDLLVENTVSSTGNLVAGSGNTITVGNDWDFTGGGTFSPGNGTVEFSTSTADGTFLSAIQADGAMSFFNLTVSSTQFVRPFSTVLFTVDGDLTVTQGTFNPLGGADVTVNGVTTIGALGFLAPGASSDVFTANGTTTNNGNIGGSLGAAAGLYVFNSDLVNNATMNGNLNSFTVNQAFTNTGTFNAGTSTVTFASTTAQTIPGVSFYNLTISKSSGTATLGGDATTTGDFQIVAGSGIFAFSTFTLDAQGDVLGTGVSSNVNVGTGTLLVSGTGAQSVSGLRLYNLTINKPSGTATLLSGNTITNDLRILSGTLDGGSVALQLSKTGTPFLILGGTFLANTSDVRYTGGTQTVASTTYYNLDLSGTPATRTLNASTTVLGTLNVGAGVTADVNTSTLTALGPITNAGLITENTAGGGIIIHPAESVVFTDSLGATQTSYTAPSTVYLQVQDSNRNLDGTLAETIIDPVTMPGGDVETVTLTETGVATGIFRSAGIALVGSTVASPGNSQFEITSTGIGTETYTDAQDSSDVVAGTATMNFTPSSGSSSGGGGGGLGSAGTTAIPAVQTQYQTYLANLQNLGIAVHTLVKLPDDGNPNTQEDTAVYYIGADGMRHAFPNDKVYFTWYSDFSQVQLIGSSQLASIPLGKNVTYKPGVKMVKFTTDPKVYAVAKGGVLRWVTSESVATSLYGIYWNTKIDDISDAFYSNYTFGTSINSSADYDVAAAMASVTFPSDSLGM